MTTTPEKQWTLTARLEYRATVLIVAETQEAAKAKFNAGEFEAEIGTAELINWAAQNHPREN